MHSGNINAVFKNGKFTITSSVDKFKSLWDDSYASPGSYNIEKYKDILEIESSKIDLDSFVAEQILSILNKYGDEDESADNECFEDYDASKCAIKEVSDGNIVIVGKLISFI